MVAIADEVAGLDYGCWPCGGPAGIRLQHLQPVEQSPRSDGSHGWRLCPLHCDYLLERIWLGSRSQTSIFPSQILFEVQAELARTRKSEGEIFEYVHSEDGVEVFIVSDVDDLNRTPHSEIGACRLIRSARWINPPNTYLGHVGAVRRFTMDVPDELVPVPLQTLVRDCPVGQACALRAGIYQRSIALYWKLSGVILRADACNRNGEWLYADLNDCLSTFKLAPSHQHTNRIPSFRQLQSLLGLSMLPAQSA